MNIIVASNNEHKIKEYREILSPLGYNVLSLKDVDIVDDAVENGTTFKENSLIKAKSVAKYTDSIIIADDSGIIIDELKGELGVYSKRFMGNIPYKDKMEAIIKRLENKNRSARFVCVITLLNYDNEICQFEGICEGSIGYKIEGEHGFGYDPIFIANGYDKSFACLDENVKNDISHRGLASKKLIDFLCKGR